MLIVVRPNFIIRLKYPRENITMKYVALVFFLISNTFFAQQIDYNTNKGYVAEGYDVVAYFDDKAIDGDEQFIADSYGVKYKFATEINLETFRSNPDKYIPQYGGYCAYAMADRGKKVGIDPKKFEIRDGKLYLFYDSFFAHTLKSWLKENPIELQKKADENWTTVMNK